MKKKTMNPFIKDEPKGAGTKKKGDPMPFKAAMKKKAGRGK